MANKKAVVANTTPLTRLAATPQGNGSSTPSVQPEIEKAIKLVELQEDLTQLIKGFETLQKQIVAQTGAIQYIQMKIAKLNKAVSEEATNEEPL